MCRPTIECRAGIAHTSIFVASPSPAGLTVQTPRASPRPKPIPNRGRVSGKSEERNVGLVDATCGLRVGEIRGLQWTDLKDGRLTVRRALDKMTNESVPPKHNDADGSAVASPPGVAG